MQYFLVFIIFAFPAFAEPPDRVCSSGKWGQKFCIRDAHYTFDVCQALRDATKPHSLDPDFFTRLIWQESRFDPNALSPAGARGIAQFMPQTARMRGLQNAYDSAKALEHSAHYLAEMANNFGNLGLAAVAYNGGETRAAGFIAKTGGLARETINYVQIITGHKAEDWRDAPPGTLDLRLDKSQSFMESCLTLAKSRILSRPKSLRPRLRPNRVKPWGMQMATGITKEKARASYRRNSRTCLSAIGKRQPDYIKILPRIPGRRTYFVARHSFNTRDSAQQLCNRIRKFQCVCAVFKNMRNYE